jgi:hypothetical protein
LQCHHRRLPTSSTVNNHRKRRKSYITIEKVPILISPVFILISPSTKSANSYITIEKVPFLISPVGSQRRNYFWLTLHSLYLYSSNYSSPARHTKYAGRLRNSFPPLQYSVAHHSELERRKTSAEEKS